MNYQHRYKQRDFDFAERLLTLRRSAKLTQEEVALRMGVTEKTIRNWEAGSNYPSDTHLEKLVELYLDKMAFTPEREQNEAHELWDRLREMVPRRIGLFDEQWFARLLQERQARSVSYEQALQGHPEASGPEAQLARLPQGDWSEAPDMSAFYGRTDELSELERWLQVDRCRLVAVLGMGGIGKTALAARLIQQVAPSFACVVWRSLHNAPSLEDVLREWLPILAQQPGINSPQEVDAGLSLLINLLQQRRCLLVLDNLETIFQEGVLEGRYRAGYEGYATLIQRIAQSAHQSCLLLTCREKFPDLGVLSGRQAPVRVFRLSGLPPPAGQQLLQDKDLFGTQAAWSELVQRYSGNPLALKIVGEMIHELFGGNIAAFLAWGVTTFHGVRQLLSQQFERLSKLEQALLYWLAIKRGLTSLETLEEDLRSPVTASAVLEAMHALRSRSLVERDEREAAFTLQPVVLEYVTERLVELVSQEIRNRRPALLLTHALLQGQAEDHVRASRPRLILQPVLEQLRLHLGSQERVEAQLDLLLQSVRALPRAEQGYAGGNIVNLLVRLNGHVKGRDCSQLAIWQADLQEAQAQDASFIGSDLVGSAFMETIDGICIVGLSPDGRYVAGGSNTGEIRLWRVTDGQPLLALIGHVGLVYTLAFHPEGRLLVSGGYDGLVKVWEISSGRCVSTLQGHTKWIESVAVHPAGQLLATCGSDGSIRLWDLPTGCCLKVLYEQHSGIWSLAFSPDGQLLVSGDYAGVVKLWKLSGEQCLWSSVAHGGSPVSSLAFSPGGEVLVSAGYSPEHDVGVQLWEVSSGKRLTSHSGHTDVVYSVCFNAEGLLASGSRDRSVKLWRLASRAGEGEATCISTLQGHSDTVRSVAWGPQGLLVSGSHDGVVKLWQITKGGEGGKCLRTLRGYSCLVNSIALSSDGGVLVSGERNGTLRIWETQHGQCLHTLPAQVGDAFAVAFHPDGRRFATGSPGGEIYLWEVDSGRCLLTLQSHRGEIWSLAFSPDGRFLLSGSDDTTVKQWEVEGGRCLATFQGQRDWVWALACSPDGQLLASGTDEGSIQLWELSSGRCLRTVRGSSGAPVALAISSDSTTLLSSNERGIITSWDVQSGDCLRTVPGIGDAYWLNSVAFSVDGSLLAAAGSDRTVKLWDVSSGELLQTLPSRPGRPWSVALSSDRRVLAAGTDEGSIQLWEWQTGQRLLALRGERPYERMNISGATGITEAQRASLKALGAIELADRSER